MSTRVIEERHGPSTALRASDGGRAMSGPRVAARDRGAPRVPRGAPSGGGGVGGHVGAPHVERRLVVTVCPRERGAVVLPVERGGRAARLDAAGVLTALRALVARRRLDDRVQVRDGCAGGCWGAGPNVDVRVYAATNPGERPDHVALGWKTYVYSLPTLASLADVIDENLPRARATRRRGR